MHNAERTEARLNYSTVSGLPPPPLGRSIPRANSRLRHPSTCRTFLSSSFVTGSGLSASLFSLIGGFVFLFLALLLLMPPST